MCLTKWIHTLNYKNNKFFSKKFLSTKYNTLACLSFDLQALQKYRGKPFASANCAVDRIRTPLAPFSLTSDVNPDPVTREHALPFQVNTLQDHIFFLLGNTNVRIVLWVSNKSYELITFTVSSLSEVHYTIISHSLCDYVPYFIYCNYFA